LRPSSSPYGHIRRALNGWIAVREVQPLDQAWGRGSGERPEPAELVAAHLA
jgi:hypothetical protein